MGLGAELGWGNHAHSEAIRIIGQQPMCSAVLSTKALSDALIIINVPQWCPAVRPTVPLFRSGQKHT